jgi:hypothetical protein
MLYNLACSLLVVKMKIKLLRTLIQILYSIILVIYKLKAAILDILFFPFTSAYMLPY